MSDENKNRIEEELRKRWQEQERQRQEHERRIREEESRRINEQNKGQNQLNDVKFYGRPIDERPGEDD